jgi:hypothetical protein
MIQKLVLLVRTRHTSKLTRTYRVIEIYTDGRYGKVRRSKEVIFDHSINFRRAYLSDMPTDDAFDLARRLTVSGDSETAPSRVRLNVRSVRNRTDHERKNCACQPNLRQYSGPPPSVLRKPPDPLRYITHIHRIDRIDPTQHDCVPPRQLGDLGAPAYPPPVDDDNIAQYWFNALSSGYEVHLLSNVETQQTLSVTLKDSSVPKTFWQAMKDPLWADAIDKELTKFEANKCFTVVPFIDQHLVPMMWLFNVKTDGTRKARLVGREDLMIPWVDFDPNAVCCGNVAANSIKMALVIAAMYKLVMRGGNLDGAYLATKVNPDFPVRMQTPQGYAIGNGMCIRAVGNLYGLTSIPSTPVLSVLLSVQS